jgi:hypothetical protein
MYLKITNVMESHHGLQYHDGLNIDIVPFARDGSCCAGGIYFTTPEYIGSFIHMGIWVREVTIPSDADMVMDPGEDKWRASKVILGPRKELWNVETLKWLVKNGTDIHGINGYALRFACSIGALEVVEYLVENGSDIHALDDAALRSSCKHLNVIKYLVGKGANIHAGCEGTLRGCFFEGNFEAVKLLIEHGADKWTACIGQQLDRIKDKLCT